MIFRPKDQTLWRINLVPYGKSESLQQVCIMRSAEANLTIRVQSCRHSRKNTNDSYLPDPRKPRWRSIKIRHVESHQLLARFAIPAREHDQPRWPCRAQSNQTSASAIIIPTASTLCCNSPEWQEEGKERHAQYLQLNDININHSTVEKNPSAPHLPKPNIPS